MAYCTVSEVLDMLKTDMMNVIIGDDYIEDEQERIKAITPLAEQAVSDAEAEIDGYLAKRYKVPFTKDHRRSSINLRKISPSTTWYQGRVLMSRKERRHI